MTVAELIKKLQALPQDVNVWIQSTGGIAEEACVVQLAQHPSPEPDDCAPVVEIL